MSTLHANTDTTKSDYDYHQDYSRVSATMLKKFLEGRRKYEAIYIDQTIQPAPPTRLMDRGAVIHQCVLQRRDVADVVCTYPDEVLNRNGGLVRARVDRFEEEHRDEFQIFMKASEVQQCERILQAIRQHHSYDYLADESCQQDKPIFWQHGQTGLACRMRPDFLLELDDVVLYFDLKVTTNYTVNDFSTYLCGNRRGGQRGWVQIAHYCEGIRAAYGKPVALRLICVNPESPNEIRIHRLAPQSLDECLPLYTDAMLDLARCRATNDFADPQESDDNVVVMNRWEIC